MKELAAIGLVAMTFGTFGLAMILMARGKGSARVRQVYRAAGLTAIAVGCLGAEFYLQGYRINLTPSIPVGIYATEPADGRALERGQVVCMEATGQRAPEALRRGVEAGIFPASWRQMPLLKVVIGAEGDRASYRELGDGTAELAVGPVRRRVLPLRRSTRSGANLPEVDFPLELVDGELWLHGEHPASFDSRYFGPVNRDAISCVAEEVWTW